MSAMDFTQWSNADPYVTQRVNFVGGEHVLRLGSYTLYEQIYWTIADAFKVVQRGSDDQPIYIPSGKQIVNTLHRYMSNGLGIVTDPTVGTESENLASLQALLALLKRERFFSEFNANKRYGIIRGDWCFRIEVDPERLEGSRLSISSVDPGRYYPVYSEEFPDEMIGVDLASVIVENDKDFILKTSYRKTTERGGPSPITMEEGVFNPDRSGLPGREEGSPERTTIPLVQFPPEIDQIPIYHIANGVIPEADWGNSELRGMERLLGAINQGISDEELSLALDGLGVYWSDGGSPVDEQGNPTDWDVGPARVVEVPTDRKFGRVQGISTVTPFQDHLKYLDQQLFAGAAIPDVARGKVNAGTAESGIALLLEMGPLLARVSEGEQTITDVLVNMLFDLKKWMAVYEGQSFPNSIWIPTYGNKIPQNRKQEFDEIITMYGSGDLVSGSWARAQLAKRFGYEFPTDADMLTEIITERTAIAQAEVDVMGARTDAELGTGAELEAGDETAEP